MPSRVLPLRWPQVGPTNTTTIFTTIKAIKTKIWRLPLRYRSCGLPVKSRGTSRNRSDLVCLAARCSRPKGGSHRSHQRQGRHRHRIWYQLWWLKGMVSLGQAPRRAASMRQQRNLTIRSRDVLSKSAILLIAITKCTMGYHHGALRQWRKPNCSPYRHHNNRWSHSKVLKLNSNKDCVGCNCQVAKIREVIISTVRLSVTIIMVVEAHRRSS